MPPERLPIQGVESPSDDSSHCGLNVGALISSEKTPERKEKKEMRDKREEKKRKKKKK